MPYDRSTEEGRLLDNQKRKERYHKRREAELKRKREYYHANKEKLNEQKKLARSANIEEYREKEREKSREQRQRRGAEINQRQRQRYFKNRHIYAERINRKRIEREPFRGIKQLTDAYRRGDKSIGELSRFINERLALANKRSREIGASEQKTSELQNGPDGSNSIQRKKHSRTNETKD